MTIEIRELVIQACVPDAPSHNSTSRIKREERRILDLIRKQVKEEVRQAHRREPWKL